MSNNNTILKVALPTPMRQRFDYLSPESHVLTVGARVKVSFGHRELIGIIDETCSHSEVASNKLKPALSVLDNESILSPQILKLCRWSSQYYQHALGEVYLAALPKLLRQGKDANLREIRVWHPRAQATLCHVPKNAKKQVKALQLILEKNTGLSESILKEHQISNATLNALKEKGLIDCKLQEQVPKTNHPLSQANKLTLNDEQANALETMKAKPNQFSCFLIEGITGSGKTEVYLQMMEDWIAAGKQCLVLIPEIGLTPQTLKRFSERFSVPIAVLHSNLNDRDRLDAWLLAKRGIAKIVIGTRSAIFTPMPDLAGIIIDEEHDSSFKQQDSFRYSARDLAVVRAQMEDIPVILGSATPSLETLKNALKGRFEHIELTQRAGTASEPIYHVIDIRGNKVESGISSQLLYEIRKTLERSEQVLLFINRRGYAPVLMCHGCGWIADCKNCDSHLTVHSNPSYLQCHHCGDNQRLIRQCPQCARTALSPIGVGTEKLEEYLSAIFTDTAIIRIDRDSTRKKGSLQDKLEQIEENSAGILIGTQMLAKGHHFPNVTLVGILDADSGFFSGDFRACEKLGQLITQVAGRAGRAEKQGHVLIQTRRPENPLLLKLIQEGYHKFASDILDERKNALLPPYSHLCLFRAESKYKERALEFLNFIKNKSKSLDAKSLFILGPIPSVMEKKAGFFRAQLLLQTQDRKHLQTHLSRLLAEIEKEKLSKQLRWTLDVDPMDVF